MCLKLGTVKYHGCLETDPNRAGILNREVLGATESEQTLQEKFKEMGEMGYNQDQDKVE